MHDENQSSCRFNKIAARNGNSGDGLVESGGSNRQSTHSSRTKQLSRKIRDHKSKSAGGIELGPSYNSDCPSWLIRHLHNAGPTVCYPRRGAESFNDYRDEEPENGTIFEPECKIFWNNYPNPKAKPRRLSTYGSDDSRIRNITTPSTLCTSSGSDDLSINSRSSKVITPSGFDCDIAQLDIDDFTPDQIQELYSQSQSSRGWSTTSRSFTISPCPDKGPNNSERAKDIRDCRCKLTANSSHIKGVKNTQYVMTGPNFNGGQRVSNGSEKDDNNFGRKSYNHRVIERLPNGIEGGRKISCHDNNAKQLRNLSNETLLDSTRPSHIRCTLCRDRTTTKHKIEKPRHEPIRTDYDGFIDHHFRFTDCCTNYPIHSRSNGDEGTSNIFHKANVTRDFENLHNSTTPSQDSCYSLAQPQTADTERGLYSDQLIGSRTSSTSGHASEGSDERDSCFVEASCSPQVSYSSSSDSLHEESPSFANRHLAKNGQASIMTNSCERCGGLERAETLLSELEDSISRKTAILTVSTDSLDAKISARCLDNAKNRANVMNNYTLTFDNGQISSSTLSSLSQSRQKSLTTQSLSPRYHQTYYISQNTENPCVSSKNRLVRDETFTLQPQDKFETNLESQKSQREARDCKIRPSFKINFADCGKRELQNKGRKPTKSKMVCPKKNTKSDEGPSGLTTWREVVSLDRENGRKRPETVSDPGTYWFGFDSFGRKSKSPVRLILSPENFIDNHTNQQSGGQPNETPSPESAGTSGYRSSASGSGGALLSLVSLFRQRKAAENSDIHSRRDDNALTNPHQDMGRDMIFSPAEEGEIVFSSHSSSDERCPENHEMREDEVPYRASMCRMGHYVDDIKSPDSPPTFCDDERGSKNYADQHQYHQQHPQEMNDVNGQNISCQNTPGILSMLQRLILQIISLICLKPAPLLPSDWKGLEPLRLEICQTIKGNGQSQQNDSHLPILLAKQVMQSVNKESPECDPSTFARVDQDKKCSKRGSEKTQIQGKDIGRKIGESSRMATSTPDKNASSLASSSLIKCQSPISLMEESLKVRSSLLSNSISLSRSGLQNNESPMDTYSPNSGKNPLNSAFKSSLVSSIGQNSVLSETASTKSLVNDCFQTQSQQINSHNASPLNQPSPQNSCIKLTEQHSSDPKRPGYLHEDAKSSKEFSGEIQLGSLYTSSTKVSSDNVVPTSPDLPDLTFLRQKWLRMRRAEEICHERLSLLTQPPVLDKNEALTEMPEPQTLKCKVNVSNEKMLRVNGKIRRESCSFMRHSSPIFEVEEEKDEESVFELQSNDLHSYQNFNGQESLHKTTDIEVYHKDTSKIRSIKSSISCPGELNKMKKTVSFSEQISLHEISDRYSPSPSLDSELRDDLQNKSFTDSNEHFFDSHWLETSPKFANNKYDHGLQQTEFKNALKNYKCMDDIPPSQFISDPLLNEIKGNDYDCSAATILDNCINDIYLSICDMYIYFNLQKLVQFWNLKEYRNISKRSEIIGIINNGTLAAEINLSTLGDSRACPEICIRLQAKFCPSIKIMILLARENSESNFGSSRNMEGASIDKIWDHIIILNQSARSCYPIYMDLVEAIERNSIQHEISTKSTQNEKNLKVNKDTKIDAFICGLINLKCLSTWMELYFNDCVSLQMDQNKHFEYGFICRLLELLKLLPFRIFLPSILMNGQTDVKSPQKLLIDANEQPSDQISKKTNGSQNETDSREREMIRLRHELMKRRSKIPVLIRTYPASTLVSPVTNKISTFESEIHEETIENHNFIRSPSSFVGRLFPKLSLALNEQTPATCHIESTNLFSRLTPRLTRKFKEHSNKNNNMDALLSPLSSPFITGGVSLFRRRSETIPEIKKEDETSNITDTPTKKVVNKKSKFSFRRATVASPQKLVDGNKGITTAVSDSLFHRNDVKIPPSTLKLKEVNHLFGKHSRSENKSVHLDKQCKNNIRVSVTLEEKRNSTANFLVKETNAPVSKLVKMKNELTKRFMKSDSQNAYSNSKRSLPTANRIASPKLSNTFNSPQLYRYETSQTTTFQPRPKTNDKLRTTKDNVIETDLSSHSSESQNSYIGPMVNGVSVCSKDINERRMVQNFKSSEKTSSSGESGIGSSDATVILPQETRDG